MYIYIPPDQEEEDEDEARGVILIEAHRLVAREIKYRRMKKFRLFIYFGKKTKDARANKVKIYLPHIISAVFESRLCKRNILRYFCFLFEKSGSR